MICIKCGGSIKDGSKFCSSCGQVTNSAPTVQQSAKIESPDDWANYAGLARSDGLSKAVMKRYKDAYRVSKAVVGIGTVIKVVGGILGGIVGLIFLVVGSAMSQLGGMYGRNEGASFVVLIVGVLYGGIVFLFFYVVGVIVSAQGQILKAGLDTSVHTSPFVSNDDKAKIMSLI